MYVYLFMHVPTCMRTHIYKCTYITCIYTWKEENKESCVTWKAFFGKSQKWLYAYLFPVDQKKEPFPNARTSAVNLFPQLDIRWLSYTLPNWMVIFWCKSCVLFNCVTTVIFFFKNHSYCLLCMGMCATVYPGGQRTGPTVWWIRAPGLTASAFHQRLWDSTQITRLAVSTFHLLRHLSNPLLPSSLMCKPSCFVWHLW